MSEVARKLGQTFGVLGEDEAWAQQLFDLFPIPTPGYALPFLDAMARVRDRVSWSAELLPVLGAAFDPLDRVRARLVEAPPKGGWLTSAKAAEGLAGDFDLAGAIHGKDTGAPQPAATEALRLILIVCLWRWSITAKRRRSSIDALAEAIRGIGRRSPQGIPPIVLHELGKATTLVGFLDAAERFREGPNRTLAEAWVRHYEPELRQPGRSVALAPGSPKPPGPSPVPPGKAGKTRKRPREITADDALIDSLIDGIRLAPSPLPAEPSLPGELDDETRPAVLIAPLAQAPTTSGDEELQRFQALQAIRHQNVHLLPNHPDAVPLASCGRIIRHLIAKIDEGDPGSDLRAGAAAMLMVAVTGRTARSLRAFRSVEPGQAHLPGSLDLLPMMGVLRMSVFWKLPIQGAQRGFFRPDEEQARRLEKVGDQIDLPLAPEIARAFKSAAADLASLATRETDDIQALLRDTMGCMAAECGLEFTAGRVRASFATHLFESCRDRSLTQLIAADSLGQSLAPLAYYAPRRQAVADAYWEVQRRLLGLVDQAPKVPDGDQRVGAQLVPVRDTVLQMAGASGNPLHGNVKRMVKAGEVEAIHRGMVNQVGTMFLAVATHRPTNALFDLTINDLLLSDPGDCALFNDKCIDVAHTPRLVVLPDIVGRQIRKYLEHLVGLAKLIPDVAQRVEAALNGTRSLLFGLDAGQAVELDVMAWRLQLSQPWNDLPQNWGRHWCRNAAVERGIRPELVQIQMGHLEAVGYPWSGASPTEPAEFVAELAPQWSQLASMQGWRIVSGLPGELPKNVGLSALRSWSGDIRANEEAFRAEHRQWKTSMVSRIKAVRAQAKADVRAVPELIEHGIIAQYDAGSASAQAHGLSRADFERIRDQLFESADDLAIGLARVDELCHLVKRVNRQCGQSNSNPAPIRYFRRPLDNAFIPTMLLAVRQIHTLREDLATTDVTGSDWRDTSLACARTVLALVLFGFCADPKHIRAAIEHRMHAVRSAGMSDVILVPWGDGPSEVLALRGIAAVAFAHFARKHKTANVQWEDVNERLGELLPDWATQGEGRGGPGWLELLCETVAVSNRFELSPAARLANGPKGSVNASMIDQLALLDGDPVGTIMRPDAGQKGALAEVLPQITPGKGSPRTQYLALCRVLPSPGADTRLPLTAVNIASGQARAEEHRRHIVAEINAMLALTAPEQRLQPIVALLACWVREMLVNGTARRAQPAFSTVATYLTRIGGGLVKVFGKSTLVALDEDELESAYDFLLEQKAHSRSQIAATILDFHRFGLAAGTLPEIDLARVLAHLGDEGATADARFILPQERSEVGRLLAQSTGGAEADSARGRVNRQAHVAFPAYAYYGARRSEVLGIRHQDLVTDHDRLILRIRSNRSRRLKTLAARRQIVLVGTDARTFGHWCALDRRRLEAYRAGTTYVFSPLGDARSAGSRSKIAETVIQACREATGRPDAKIHGLRHLVAMECVFPSFLAKEDHDLLSTKLALKPLATGTQGVLLPRDLHGQVVGLGHADPSTTLRWYVHLPWLLQSRAMKRVQQRYANAPTLAPLLGLTRHAIHWNVKKSKRDSRIDGLLDVELPSRPVPVSKRPTPHQGEGSSVHWTAQRIGELLATEDRIGSLAGALQVVGAGRADELAIMKAIIPIEGRLGRRLVREERRDEALKRPRRHLRRMDQDAHLESLWKRFDEGVADERAVLAAISRSVVDHMRPKDLDTIHLPKDHACQLGGLLEELGIGAIQQTCTSPSMGMVTLKAWWERRSQERSATARAGGGAGLAIKRVLAVIDVASRLGREGR